MDKGCFDWVLGMMEEDGSSYLPYVRERTRSFAERIADDPGSAPRTGDELEDASLLLACLKGFLLGYGIAVDGGYCKAGAAILPAATASPQWAPILSAVPASTPAMHARASLLMEGLVETGCPLPTQYYAVRGFLEGMVEGEHDLESGAAEYFSEKRPEDDLMLEIVAGIAAKEMFSKYAEDIYLSLSGGGMGGGEPPILGKVAACAGLPCEACGDDEVLALLDSVSCDIAGFLKYRCGGMSGANERPNTEEQRWAEVYADHYILGLFECLLGALDRDGGSGTRCHPRLDGEGYGSPADSLRISMLERGNCDLGDIELAIRHMKVTWDSEKGCPSSPPPEDLYWQACGLAYAEGARRARSLDGSITA